MDKILKDTLQSGDMTMLEKYIDKYLPSDQENLQRIYKQLLDYSPPGNHVEKQEQVVLQRNLLLAVVGVQLNRNFIRKKKQINQKNRKQATSQQNIKKSKNLLLQLRNRGIDPKSKQLDEQDACLQQGLQIFNHYCAKLLSPMHPNIQARFLHKIKANESKLKQLFQKYQINRQLYEKGQEQNDSQFKGFSYEMIQFMKKRNKSIKDINNHKEYDNTQKSKAKQYKTIRSRVYSSGNLHRNTRVTMAETNLRASTSNLKYRNSFKKNQQRPLTGMIVKQKKQNKVQDFKDKFQLLLEGTQNTCKSIPLSISKQSIKNLIKYTPKNMFEELEQKIENIRDQNMDINEKTKKIAHNQFITNYYQRYNRQYIKMLKPKDETSKFNKYQRDLLLDPNHRKNILI